jgi:AraC-like DNA-binding protein
MSIISEARPSDSPYIELVMRGYTASDGATIRPAESHWHLVLRKLSGKTDLLVVGPWTSAGALSYTEGAELLWIKLKLGVFMPHLPTRNLLDSETVLPGAACQSFWLGGSTWQFPAYDNVETFISRLAHKEVLARDPLVNVVMREQNQAPEMPPRTLRHRFLRATGLSQRHIQQIERAQQAADLLRQGTAIADTIYQAGYFDQPHLTRSLKRWVGYTPAQILTSSR